MATLVTAPVVSEGSGLIVVLFALEREAAPFRRAARGMKDLEIAVSGIGRRRAKIAAERAVAFAPRLVIAAGFCGSLQAGVTVGTVIHATEVIGPDKKTWPCAVTGNDTSQRLVTSPSLIATRAEKLQLGEAMGALAVDMESADIAEVCERNGIPFVAMRAISDSVERELSLDLVWLLAAGNVSIWRALRALIKKPSLILEFRRLARDTRLAARNLADALVKFVARSRNSGSPLPA